MALEIVVPEVSDGVTAGTVIALAVKVGDAVAEDQTLLELETDKAVVAVPSPAAGKISEIRIGEGDQVEIGAVIMLLEPDVAADEPPETEPEAAAQPQTEERQPVGAEATAEPAASEELPAAATAAPAVDLESVRREDRVAPAAPAVRRMARELGVDIYQVSGSGPGGRIGEEDVRAFVRDTLRRSGTSGGGAAPATTLRKDLPDFEKWGPTTRQPLSRVRELTAEAMSYAWATIPMVTQYDKVDVTAVERFRKDYNAAADAADKLTLTAILVKVCGAALQAFPQFNSSLDPVGRELILKNYVHIGVAVDTANGLLVPVLRDVADKGIEQLARELNDLAARTRERKVAPDELEGGTFTISNLGGIGGTAFTPIVYAPQVAILGVSRAEMQPVWNGREFTPQLLVNLSLSYDHRVIDGADGARFLRWICAAVENPFKLLMH